MIKSVHNNKIIQLGFSIVLIPFWGLTLLSNEFKSPFSILICFIITSFLLWFIKKKYPNNKDILLLVGPTFYFLFFLYVSFALNIPNRIITSPLVWIYCLYVFIFLIEESIKKVYLILIILFFSLLSMIVYSSINDYYFFQDSTSEYLPDNNINNAPNLNDFKFLNNLGNEINIQQSGKIIFIETWNETCIPCIKSITEIQDSISEIPNLEHIYLYQFSGKRKFSNKQIFNFKHINDKRKILIDIDNKLMEKFGIKSYPYFLIFKADGSLIKAFKGYKSDYKNLIVSTFKQTIKKAKMEK